MTTLIVILCFALLVAARAGAGPQPAFGPKVLASLIEQTNACRLELGLHPIKPGRRAWRGDAWDRARIRIWRERRDAYCGIVHAAGRDARLAIRIIFGRHAHEALVVARCESRFSTTARNGQYLGLFQMGSSERARFGHGSTALEQARAAHRYFLVSGWSPWQCSPYGGLAW